MVPVSAELCHFPNCLPLPLYVFASNMAVSRVTRMSIRISPLSTGSLSWRPKLASKFSSIGLCVGLAPLPLNLPGECVSFVCNARTNGLFADKRTAQTMKQTSSLVLRLASEIGLATRRLLLSQCTNFTLKTNSFFHWIL